MEVPEGHPPLLQTEVASSMGCPFLAAKRRCSLAVKPGACGECGNECGWQPDDADGPARNDHAVEGQQEVAEPRAPQTCCVCARRDRMPSIRCYYVNEFGFFPRLEPDADVGYYTCDLCAKRAGDACAERAEAIDRLLREAQGDDTDLSTLAYLEPPSPPVGIPADHDSALSPASAQFLLLMDAVNHYARATPALSPSAASHVGSLLASVLTHAARFPGAYRGCIVAIERGSYLLKNQVCGRLPEDPLPPTATPPEGWGTEGETPAWEPEDDPLHWPTPSVAKDPKDAPLARRARYQLRFEAREEGERLVCEAPGRSSHGTVSRVGNLFRAAELFRACGAAERVAEARRMLDIYLEGWATDPGLAVWEGQCFGTLPKGALRGMSDAAELEHRHRVRRASMMRRALEEEVERLEPAAEPGSPSPGAGSSAAPGAPRACGPEGDSLPEPMRRLAALDPKRAIHWRRNWMKTRLDGSLRRARGGDTPGAEAERIMRQFTGEQGGSSPSAEGGYRTRDAVTDFLETKAEARASRDSALVGGLIALTAVGAFEWIASTSESVLLARLLGRDEGQRRMGLIIIGVVAVMSLLVLYLLAGRRANRAKKILRQKLKVE